MTIPEAHDTYDLPLADSDPLRQRRTRARAHALLVGGRQLIATDRRSARLWIEAALVGAASALYLSSVIVEALRLVSLP